MTDNIAAAAQPAEPTQPTTPAIQAAVQAAEAPPAVSSELLERATKLGIEVGDTPDYSAFVSKLFDAYEADRPFAQHGRQALATPPAQPAAGKEEPATEAFDLDKHFQNAWKLPELSAGAQWALQHGAFTENEQGAIVAKPGLENAALPYLREIQEYVQAESALQADYRKNPVRFMYDRMIEALRHELRSDFEQYDNEARSRSEAETFEKQFAQENKDWLFTADGKLSPEGEKFRQQVEYWRGKGVSDHQALAQLAAMASKPSAPAQPESQPTAQAPAADRGDGRNGRGQFVSRQESFLESAKRQSAASAGGGRSAPSAEDYVPANRGELESIWTRRFREAKSGAA